MFIEWYLVLKSECSSTNCDVNKCLMHLGCWIGSSIICYHVIDFMLLVSMIILAAWNIVRLLLWLKGWKKLCFLVLPKCLNCVSVCCSYIFYRTPIVVLLSLLILFLKYFVQWIILSLCVHETTCFSVPTHGTNLNFVCTREWLTFTVKFYHTPLQLLPPPPLPKKRTM